jgi:hypothetical protein
MMKRLILTVALLLAPLSWAGAQTPAQRIQAARQHASQAGIPVALLDSKVAEGHAKGVPDERIAMAVERRLGSLQRARDAMAGQAALTPADLNVGADAVEAGVDPGVLGRLARQAAPDRRAVAIAVLTELVKDGVASEQALQRVTAALARGAEELRRLPGDTHGNSGNSGNAAARHGPPDVRGPANAAAHGGHANGGGPPASVPAPGDRGHGHGKGNGKP